MCWGTPAVVLEVSEDSMIAKIDFGDGIVREAIIGITSSRLSKGDIVIVHAGVVISKLDHKGIVEHMNYLKEALGEEADGLLEAYREILSLAQVLKGGEANG